jgi:hypothetical protein
MNNSGGSLLGEIGLARSARHKDTESRTPRNYGKPIDWTRYGQAGQRVDYGGNGVGERKRRKI